MSLTQARLLTILSRCPLLEGLSEERLSVVMQQMQVNSYRKGIRVLHEGEQADSLCFLLEGRLKVVTFTGNGREIGLSVVEPVSHFGEMALIDNQPRSASVVAVTKSLVGVIPKSAALKGLLAEPSISLRLMRDLVQMLRNANHQLLLLGYQHAQTRIAALLLQTLQDQGRQGHAAAPLSQQDLANMTNTTRETVSRVLNQFVDEGILRRDGRKLTIMDAGRLKQALLEGEGR